MKKYLVILIISLITFAFSVDIYFYQTDIRDALNQLGMQEGVSIIYDPLISGFISVEAYNITLEKALDLMLLPLGYYWTKIDNVYFVGTANPDSPNFALISKKYLLNLRFITFDDLYNALPKIMTNYIYKTPNKNQVLIYAPAKIASQIAETITLIDKQIPVAEIQVKIIEIDESDFKKFGVSWNNEENNTTSYNNGNLQLSLNPLNVNFNIIMDTLISSGNAKVLAEGTLKLKSNSTSQITGYTTVGFTLGKDNTYVEKKINTQIIISGYVFADHANLTLKSIVESFIQNSSTFTPVGASVETNLDIKYEQPYYIAGLSFDSVTKQDGGIPGLKDIPIIGNLFKNSTYTSRKKNIVIFIKARLAGEDLWKR